MPPKPRKPNIIIDKYVERYGNYYEGILTPESIEKSKAFWRKELEDVVEEARREEAVWWYNHETELVRIIRTKKPEALEKHGSQSTERIQNILTNNHHELTRTIQRNRRVRNASQR